MSASAAAARRAQIANAYNAFFQRRVLSEHPEYYSFIARLCDGRCLDVACANGGWLLSRVPQAIGIDISSVAVAQLRDRGLRACVGDAEELPFADETFDTVVSLGSLEHFLHPEAAIAEMARVLKTGGTLILTFNAKAALPYVLFEKLLLLWGRFRLGSLVTQPIDARLPIKRVAAALLRHNLRVIFEGTYTRQILHFGRLQGVLRPLLPFRWRSTPCVHFFYCKKGDFGKEAEYGVYFPRR
jgi:SAM-dependent methyltransferase